MYRSAGFHAEHDLTRSFLCSPNQIVQGLIRRTAGYHQHIVGLVLGNRHSNDRKVLCG